MASEIPVLSVFENLPGIRAFFTTRQGGNSTGPFASLNLGSFSGDDPATVRQNWARLLQLEDWGERGLALPRLCHGAASAAIEGDPARKASLPGSPALEPEGADAVYTSSARWVLAVTMADCLPALIADPVTRCVAAVHAGWRGTRDEVLRLTLERLFAEGRCRPASTHVALGPCLSVPALEVSEDVALLLPKRHTHRDAGRYYFDLRGANRGQSLEAGVPSGNITESPVCTYENADACFSYRRDGGVTGRMAACIALAR
jgi:YfiH family protein